MNLTLFAYWNTIQIPLFQELCVSNFKRYNPTWNVFVFNEEIAPTLLGDLLPMSWSEMSPQLQSDAVRLAALRKFGGAWLDITSMFVRPNSLQEMWDEMILKKKELRGYTWMTDNILDSWFLMATPNSLLVAQWHDIFLLYLESREQVFDIHNHNLFAPIHNWYETQRLQSECFNCINYLAIHSCFLRVQSLNEWENGEWKERVLLERAHEKGYYVPGTLCKAGFCMCTNPELGGYYKGHHCVHDIFWSNYSVTEISKYTPLLKLNGNHYKALDVSTNEKAQKIFITESLLQKLLLPFIRFNYTENIEVDHQNIHWRSPQYVYTIQWIRFTEGIAITLFTFFAIKIYFYFKGDNLVKYKKQPNSQLQS